MWPKCEVGYWGCLLRGGGGGKEDGSVPVLSGFSVSFCVRVSAVLCGFVMFVPLRGVCKFLHIWFAWLLSRGFVLAMLCQVLGGYILEMGLCEDLVGILCGESL